MKPINLQERMRPSRLLDAIEEIMLKHLSFTDPMYGEENIRFRDQLLSLFDEVVEEVIGEEVMAHEILATDVDRAFVKGMNQSIKEQRTRYQQMKGKVDNGK